MGLVRDLRAQLGQVADRSPAAAVIRAQEVLEEMRARLDPELTDSDNPHAHAARDALMLLVADIEAACPALAQAREDTLAYEASR